jgi:hypothetical protein
MAVAQVMALMIAGTCQAVQWGRYRYPPDCLPDLRDGDRPQPYPRGPDCVPGCLVRQLTIQEARLTDVQVKCRRHHCSSHDAAAQQDQTG